jgi:hypothetical protein
MYGNEFLNLFDVTQRSLVAVYTCFGAIFCLHLHGEDVCEVVDISASTQRSANLNDNGFSNLSVIRFRKCTH